MTPNLESFTHLTFDCYGTLIDWESGILAALVPVVAGHDLAVGEAELLELYARHEARLEAGPYRPYKEILQGVMAGIGEELGFTTAWVNRPSRCPGTGVAPPAEVVPDFEFPDLESLAVAAGL